MDKMLKILMLEDVPEDADLIDRALKKAKMSFVSMRVDTKDEFIEAISDFIPDIILSDHSLPQFNSIEALKICRKKNNDLPFILVTGTVSEEFAVNALKEGADDYILKGNLTRLPSAILNTLKQRKEEQNRKKAEKSLQEQNTELVKINQELDRFVYSASHDLKAPLKSVLGLLRLAENDLANSNYESMATYHKMIEGSVFKLDCTIKEIENYSRNLRTQVQVEEIDLSALISEVLESLQYIEGKNQIHTTVNIQGLCAFYSDRSRLKIILSNIISNAIKYRDWGKKQCCLIIDADVSEDGLVVKMEDNGIGIHPDYIEKIYDMFYRATEKSEGSGLGLYIVKETVSKLKGIISVESIVREKTIFTIAIPNLTTEKK
jgi:signal transduction histidine kinase